MEAGRLPERSCHLSMCDGSGDGEKWKLERCLRGHVNRSWREAGFAGRIQRLSGGCLGSGFGELRE